MYVYTCLTVTNHSSYIYILVKYYMCVHIHTHTFDLDVPFYMRGNTTAARAAGRPKSEI